MDTAHHLDAQRPDTHTGGDDGPEGDACSWRTGGSWGHTPPEYCDMDAEPGEEYCFQHMKQYEVQREWETEVGPDDV